VAKWKKWAKELVFLVIFTAIAASAIGYFRAPSFKGEALPPIAAQTLEGKTFDTGTQKGRPYILHFWATWCPVCRAEAGNVDALAKDAKVVTVAVKSGDDAALKQFMKEHGLSYTVINDANGAIASEYKIGVFPTTIIVGRDGKVFWAESGYTTTWGLRFRFWLADTF
jgi:thiol-disulfide isomerase/thioredoxin